MKIKKLPLPIDIETKQILKKAISANRALANLNGVARTIPNQNIIINSLVLQEAKDSSGIEKITQLCDENDVKFELKEEPSFISIIFYRKTDRKVSNSAENMPNNAELLPNSAKKVSNSIELNLYDQKILEYLQNHKQIVSEEVEQLLDIKERRAREILSNMAKRGLLQKIGKTKGSYYILNY